MDSFQIKLRDLLYELADQDAFVTDDGCVVSFGNWMFENAEIFKGLAPIQLIEQGRILEVISALEKIKQGIEL